MKLLIQSLIIIVFLANCSTPTHMKLTVRATQNSNLDSEKISSPLMLKFYELKTAEKFTKLDFWSLSDQAQEQLGDNLISQTKHIIVPNEEHIYKILFSDDAKFIGVIASFQNIENNATWRYIKKLEPAYYNTADLIIDENHIKEDD